MADNKSSTKQEQDLNSKASPTPFIDASNAFDAYDESRKWLNPYFQPIEEFERIARNKPSEKISPELPRITDGTMASIIQEGPKRIIQRIATGEVKSESCPEYAAVANIVLFDKLIPMSNRMGDYLQKSWNMLGKAMTWGSSASYTFYASTNNKLHTDFVIPYRKDVISEKGKVFAPDSNISFMRSWYQKRDLKGIYNRETLMEKNIKGYKSDWNLPALVEFMNTGASAKPADLQTAAEREKGGDTGGYEVIHCFQDGVGAESYSIAPKMAMAKGSKGAAGMLRQKVNKDPRGKMPIDWLYCNIDLSNPVGRGQIELSGGVQNLIDQQMQMFQFLTTLEMGPPLQTWGSVNKASLKFRPNAIWDMGTGANNKVEPYVVNNQSISNFPNNYGLLKSQIMNLNSSQDHSMSSPATGSSQSKTQAGVQASEQRLGISDNYLRKQYESWFSRQSETSLNIFFSEMTGESKIEVGPLEIQRLESTAAAKFITKDKKALTINYGDIKDAVFTFRTDPSSTKEAEDQEQLEKLQEILTEINASGPVLSWYLGQDGKKLNVGELYRQRFERLGLQNLDVILTDMDAKEAEAAKQQPFPIIDKPQIRLTGQLPPASIPAALGAGGIQLQPGNPAMQSPVDYADILKDPNTPLSIKQQIWQAGGLQPAPGDPTAMPQQPQPSGPTPEELALRQQELAIKQQNANDNSAKVALDVSKTAHQHTMDQHNAIMSAQQHVQDQQFQAQQSQQQQQAQAAQAAQTAQPTDDPSTMSPSQDTMSPSMSPDQGQAPALDDALTPDEEKLVHALLHQGFNEQDAEQAIVMLRQGTPVAQVRQILGAKYAK